MTSSGSADGNNLVHALSLDKPIQSLIQDLRSYFDTNTIADNFSGFAKVEATYSQTASTLMHDIREEFKRELALIKQSMLFNATFKVKAFLLTII